MAQHMIFSCTKSLPAIVIFFSLLIPPSAPYSLPGAKPRTAREEFLSAHNSVRSRLGLPPLRWSRKLARYASWWALKRAGDCALVHSGGPYGENLFWGSGPSWRPRQAVSTWASERRYYDGKRNMCVGGGMGCLHYTQIVWRRSRKVGCARLVCRTGDTFITCNYDPHGNVVGQKPF